MPAVPIARVAMIFASDFAATSPGGIMTIVREYLRRLSARLAVVFVGVADAGGEEALRARIGTATVTPLAVLAASRRFRWIPLNIAFTAALFRRRRRILGQADLIHIHRMEYGLPFVIRKTRPVVLTVHGSSKFHTMSQTGLLRWRAARWLYDVVEGYVFSRVDRIVLVSHEALDYYRRRRRSVSRKFVVVPNFIDASEFHPADRAAARSAYGLGAADLAVAYVGRLVREKRVDLVIDAFARLVRERPAARLLIAGDGPDEPRLRQHAAGLGLQQVRFLGLLGKADVRTLLSAADTLVLLSRFEGFPMVVLEALACGLPVVASDVGGVREILTGGLAELIVSAPDPEAVKRKIVEAVERREALSARCIARAEAFDAARVIPALERVYFDLVRPSP